MTKVLLLACGMAALAGPAFAETLAIRDFAGRVEIVTGDYARLEVEVIPGKGGPSPEVTHYGDRIEVDGGLGRDFIWNWDGDGAGCRGDDGDRRVRLERGGEFYAFSELPVIRATGPRDIDLDIQGVLMDGEAGAVGAIDVDLAGCARLAVESAGGPVNADLAGAGVLTIRIIAGELDADVAGAGVLAAGDVRGPLVADVAGAGRLDLGAVRSGGDIDVAGAAHVRIARLDGDLQSDIAGAGVMEIEDGQLGVLDLDVAGMGDMDFCGFAREAVVDAAGVGTVEIANAADADVGASRTANVRVNGQRVR